MKVKHNMKSLYIFAVLLFTASLCDSKPSSGKFDGEHKSPAIALPETRIVGGRKTTISKHPHLISVTRNGQLEGAAVILNKYWAVTAAAHFFMFNKSSTVFRAGSSSTIKGGVNIQLDKYFNHPNYTQQWNDDVAVFKFENPLKFTKSIKPISMASSLPRSGKFARVGGWGADVFMGEESDGNTLKEANVRVRSFKECKKYYKNDYDVIETNFCTINNGIGPCKNDWGDPLVYKKKLIGLFVGSWACGSLDYPPLYADITKFKSWIAHTLKANSETEEMAHLY